MCVEAKTCQYRGGRPRDPLHASDTHHNGWLAFHRQCHGAELAAFDGVSMAGAGLISGHASSEGQGDAAAYQAS